MLTDAEWADVDRIPGWLHRAEADCIARHARSPWCEVGAWQGRSTIVLRRSGYGFVVDTFAGSGEPECPAGSNVRDEWERHVGWPCQPQITVLQGSFDKMWVAVPAGLGLLYLDGPHSYDETRLAWSLYTPLVAPDGVVLVHDAWHDSGWPAGNPWHGVTRWVQEVLDRGDWEQVDHAARIAVLRRVA